MPQTVLLADDNVAVQKLVELTLQKEGYDVVTSDNGLSALDLALKETPGLILADYSLEGLDIVSFVKKTRQKERLSDVPIVLLVNSTDHYDSTQLESAGVQSFIEKPIDSKSLVEEVYNRIASSGRSSIDPDASFSAKEESQSEDILSKEEEMKIEQLLGWSSSAIPNQDTEEKAVTGDGVPVEAQGEILPDPERESSLEETQYFQPPPIAEGFEEEEHPEADAPSMDEVHQLHQLHDEPSLSSVLSEMESEVEEEHPEEDDVQKNLGNNIQDAVEKVLGEKLPDMVKSSLSSETITSIIERVVWDVVPSLAEIEIKKEMKRLQSNEG